MALNNIQLAVTCLSHFHNSQIGQLKGESTPRIKSLDRATCNYVHIFLLNSGLTETAVWDIVNV